MDASGLNALGASHGSFAPASRAAAPGGGKGFGEMLSGLVEQADHAQKQSDQLVQQMARGEPTDIHQVVVALSEADLTFRTLLEVRNRLVDAYQEIQRMPV